MLATSRLTVTVLVLSLAGSLALPAPVAAQTAETPNRDDLPYEIQEISSGVWAALQPAPLRFNDSNTLVIETDDGVVVIDSQSDPQKVERLAAEIRRRTGRPVRYLINTHWHGDHTQGNAVYARGAEPVIFVAHASWWEDVQSRGLPQLTEQLDATRAAIARAEERLATGERAEKAELGQGEATEPMSEEERADLVGRIERARARVERLAAVEIPPPTLTFGDRLTLHLTWRGEPRTLELIHLRGHTRGDLVVHLPEERLLASGDLLDALPFGGHGYPRAWLEALDRLLRLDPRTIVPGHGPVFEGTDQIRQVRELLSELVAQAKGAVRRDEPLEAARERMMESPEMAALRERLAGDDELALRVFRAFVPATFERAYLEEKGELPD